MTLGTLQRLSALRVITLHALADAILELSPVSAFCAHLLVIMDLTLQTVFWADEKLAFTIDQLKFTCA